MLERATRPDPLSVILAGVLAVSVVAAAFSPAPAVAQLPDAPFTIADALSSPMPSDLVAAPDGGRIAWVRNHRGVRNIWVAAAPDWRPRQVTDYARDIGITPGGLELTRDGRWLLYGVGGSPNRFGDFRTPRRWPTARSSPSTSSTWRPATAGRSPAARPGPSRPTGPATS